MKLFRKHVVLSSFLLCLLGTVAFFVVTDSRAVIVNGSSMLPLYVDGERLMTHTPRSEEDLEGNPVCWVHLDSGEDVIKRLIGYPGQTVWLKDGDTYVDGVLLMERSTESYDNMIISLGTGQYLFLGDNRANSLDGRYWNPRYVGFDNIKGVVVNSQLSEGG